MVGSAQAAREGITVSTFPAGTIFSVALHPLRSGEPAGSRVGGALFRCPERTPPPPGKHCDAVEGHTRHGQGELPKPTEWCRGSRGGREPPRRKQRPAGLSMTKLRR